MSAFIRDKIGIILFQFFLQPSFSQEDKKGINEQNAFDFQFPDGYGSKVLKLLPQDKLTVDDNKLHGDDGFLSFVFIPE
jgi:hypothetical protein